ncbi:MAG: N-acetyltransferase family protein [Bdellovibrionales bacterium]
MKNIKIRPAVKKDTSEIFQAIKALAKYEKLEHEVVATEEMISEEVFGKNSRIKVFVAEMEDGKIAGISLVFYSFSTFLGRKGIYLEDLFVYPEFRGKGIGKALLKNLAKICVSEKLGRLEWSVLDWNKPAIDFYESVGAGAQDGWTVYRLSGDSLKTFADQ